MGATSTGGAVNACVDIGGSGGLVNNVAGSSDGLGGSEIRVRQRFTSSVHLPNFAGGGTVPAVTYLRGRNTLSGVGVVTVTSDTPANLTGGGACTQAPQ